MSKHVRRCRQCPLDNQGSCSCRRIGGGCACSTCPICLRNLNNLVAKFRPGLVLGAGKYSTINLCASIMDYYITACSGDSGDAKLVAVTTTRALSLPLCHCRAWMLSNAANGKGHSMNMGRQHIAVCPSLLAATVALAPA